MKIYNDIGSAYYDLLEDKIIEEQRDINLKYIFTSSMYSLKFIKEDLYRNNQEMEKAINTCLRNIDSSLNLLKYSFHLLTDEQILKIIENSLTNWTSSLELLKSFNNLLTEEQKNIAFEMIMLNENATIKLLLSDIVTKKQRLFILNNLSHVKNVNLTILEYYSKEIDEREMAFNSIIKSNSNKMDLYKLAKKNKLNHDEKEKLYQTHHKFYYDDSKYKLIDYYEYCKVFQDFLNDHEQQLLIKKAIRNQSIKVMDNILSNIKLPDKYKDKLQGAQIAQKLIKGY